MDLASLGKIHGYSKSVQIQHITPSGLNKPSSSHVYMGKYFPKLAHEAQEFSKSDSPTAIGTVTVRLGLLMKDM